MADTENTTVGFEKQLETERLYYLGKFKPEDNIPGTDMTIGDGREAYAEANKKAEEDLRKRTEAYYERQKAKGNKSVLAITESVQTTLVSPVAPLVDIKSSASGLENLNPVLPVVDEVQIVAPAGGDDVFAEYTRDQLESLEAPKKEKLVAIAESLKIEGNQIPSRNDDLVELILKTQADRRKPIT